MAEENTERNEDEAEELESTDSPLEGEPDAGDEQTSDNVQAQEIAKDSPESANEALIGDEVPVVQSTHVSSADGTEITTPIADISMLLDIPVTLSMEIGQTKISISELLKLSKDSVIELQRMAHEPLDVLVNGTLVAHGEAVVVGDRFGIRLTDVISPQERLRKFG